MYHKVNLLVSPPLCINAWFLLSGRSSQQPIDDDDDANQCYRLIWCSEPWNPYGGDCFMFIPPLVRLRSALRARFVNKSIYLIDRNWPYGHNHTTLLIAYNERLRRTVQQNFLEYLGVVPTYLIIPSRLAGTKSQLFWKTKIVIKDTQVSMVFFAF